MHLRPELKGTNSIKSKSMQNRRSQALHSLWQGNILARFLFDLFMHQLNNAKYFSPFLLYLLVHQLNESNSSFTFWNFEGTSPYLGQCNYPIRTFNSYLKCYSLNQIYWETLNITMIISWREEEIWRKRKHRKSCECCFMIWVSHFVKK